jgi:hypothetical protein
VKGRPTRAQLAALVVSISVNAVLWLGLRQVGRIESARGPDEDAVDVVFVVDVPHVLAPPRTAGKHASVPARRRPGTPRARPPGNAGRPAGPSATLVVVTEDRWAPAADAAAAHVQTTFEHAFAGPADERAFEPRARLAPLPFRDTTFGGILADLAKREDCKALRYAIRFHRESAATVVATMLRTGCKP